MGAPETAARLPQWLSDGPMTLFKVGWIASRHETDIAHATLAAVAQALASGASQDDEIGGFDPAALMA